MNFSNSFFTTAHSLSGCKCKPFFLSAKLFFQKKISFLLPDDIGNGTYMNVALPTPFPQAPELLRWRGANLPPFFRSARVFYNFFGLFQRPPAQPPVNKRIAHRDFREKGKPI